MRASDYFPRFGRRAPSFGLNVVTLGVGDFARSVRFYGELGLPAKMTGDEVAFFDAGGVVLALFRWEVLAANAGLPDAPRPQAFRGAALARTCRSDADVDVTLAHALRIGARLLKPARRTSLGGYSGFFADPDGHPWEVVCVPGFSSPDVGRVARLD